MLLYLRFPLADASTHPPFLYMRHCKTLSGDAFRMRIFLISFSRQWGVGRQRRMGGKLVVLFVPCPYGHRTSQKGKGGEIPRRRWTRVFRPAHCDASYQHYMRFLSKLSTISAFFQAGRRLLPNFFPFVTLPTNLGPGLFFRDSFHLRFGGTGDQHIRQFPASGTTDTWSYRSRSPSP